MEAAMIATITVSQVTDRLKLWRAGGGWAAVSDDGGVKSPIGAPRPGPGSTGMGTSLKSVPGPGDSDASNSRTWAISPASLAVSYRTPYRWPISCDSITGQSRLQRRLILYHVHYHNDIEI